MIPFERMIEVDGKSRQCKFITKYKTDLPLFWYVVEGGKLVYADAYHIRFHEFGPIAVGHSEDDEQ